MSLDKLPGLTLAQAIDLLAETDADRKIAAIEQIEDFNELESLVPLIPLLSDPADEIRAAATSAVVRVAANLWEMPESYFSGKQQEELREAHELIRTTIIPKFKELVSDPYWKIRLLATRGMLYVARYDTDALLVNLLKDPQVEIRRFVIGWFSAFTSQEDIPYLIDALSETDFSIRQEAIRGLGIKKAQKAVPYLIPLLSDENMELRLETLGALSEIKAKELELYLPALLADPNPDIRSSALNTVRDMSVATCGPQLIELLSANDYEVVLIAAEALVHINVPNITDILFKLIDTQEDFYIRTYAVSVLGQVGNLETIPILEELTAKELDRTDGFSIWATAAPALKILKKRFL